MGLFKKKKKIDENILKDIYKKDRIKRYIELLLGLFIISIAFNLFLLPNDIVFGGVSGLSIIFQKIFDWNPATFILISSLLLLCISYYFLGKEVTGHSVLGSILLPVLIELTGGINELINLGETEMLLAAIFGGLLYGFGAGLVFRAGFTTGGTDIINQIISKYFHKSMGTSMLLSDGLIVVCGAFIFGINRFMYAIITVYIIGILTDKVLLGISDSKAFYIITEEAEHVRKFILEDLNHGVTIFDAKGGFTKEKQKVLLCVVPTKEYFKLKEGIHSIDKNAFFVVTDAYEVIGGE